MQETCVFQPERQSLILVASFALMEDMKCGLVVRCLRLLNRSLLKLVCAILLSSPELMYRLLTELTSSRKIKALIFIL